MDFYHPKREYEEFLTISNGNMRCFKATKIAKKWNNSGVLTPMMIQNWRFQNPWWIFEPSSLGGWSPMALATVVFHEICHIKVQDGAPQWCECCFINHEIIPINYSYIYHKPLNSVTYFYQLNAILGVPSCTCSTRIHIQFFFETTDLQVSPMFRQTPLIMVSIFPS